MLDILCSVRILMVNGSGAKLNMTMVIELRCKAGVAKLQILIDQGLAKIFSFIGSSN